ncbi:hypothetical protein [Actinomadura madurae]|uniref:hypothetical protein n=1 Tax=Actinomadura madurae TaxID=1993 RepID=UPI0020D23707|nr:hypothetical protein [Actinomadura madurae]MCQ0008907.1 hypothetical protein [Actinomadura madurae]
MLGWAAQVAIRLWLGSGQTVPVATPDESGYLFAARVLTGGPDADMSFGTVYRGGYPLLLTPAFWFATGPVGVYRAALVINALVSAVMLPLAYLLLRRFRLRRRWSYVFAHVTALLPCVLFYSEFVLTDAILPVVLVGWLLLVHAWLDAPPPAGRRSSVRLALSGTGASLLVAYAYACHTRGAILLAVHAALLAAALVLRWRSWRASSGAALVLAAATAAGMLLNRSLLPHMYPQGDNDLGGNVARRLTTLDGWGWMLSLGTGQVWYQAVATGGVAAVGLVTAAFLAVRPAAAPARPGPVRALALAVLALVAASRSRPRRRCRSSTASATTCTAATSPASRRCCSWPGSPSWRPPRAGRCCGRRVRRPCSRWSRRASSSGTRATCSPSTPSRPTTSRRRPS